jgi:hypothetical protein
VDLVAPESDRLDRAVREREDHLGGSDLETRWKPEAAVDHARAMLNVRRVKNGTPATQGAEK